MSSPFHASETHGTANGRAVSARAYGAEPHAAYYIDTEGVIVRAQRDPPDRDPVLHTWNGRGVSVLVALFAATCAGLVALVVYRLASLWWP